MQVCPQILQTMQKNKTNTTTETTQYAQLDDQECPRSKLSVI